MKMNETETMGLLNSVCTVADKIPAIEDAWAELCEAIAQTFRFTADEKTSFTLNRTARLIGSIPFAALCSDAKRTALAHLAVYITELRGGFRIGAHTNEDDASVYMRLRLLSSFKGGDQKIIEHGMTQLSLIMLCGYKKSAFSDSLLHIYNPLNKAGWVFDALYAELVQKLQDAPCPDLDAIMPLENIGNEKW